MKNTIDEWDGWLRRRLRMYIWKQWKKPKTRVKNLMKLGMEDWKAYRNGNTRKGYWAVAGSGILKTTITNERLAQAGYFDMARKYKSLHSLYRIFEATRRDPGSGPVCSSPPRGRCR